MPHSREDQAVTVKLNLLGYDEAMGEMRIVRPETGQCGLTAAPLHMVIQPRAHSRGCYLMFGCMAQEQKLGDILW